VPVLQAPPLARALYAHTEVDQEIPAALFAAVAQVLAWVYQLRDALAGPAAAPAMPPVPGAARARPALNAPARSWEPRMNEPADATLNPAGPAQAAPLKALVLPVFVVMMLAMMVLPLPPFVLDLLFTFNIALALMVMMVAAQMIKPLDFAACPPCCW
jgi:hypothetical protein